MDGNDPAGLSHCALKMALSFSMQSDLVKTAGEVRARGRLFPRQQHGLHARRCRGLGLAGVVG